MDLDDFMQRSNAKARRRRILARQMFGAAIITLSVTAFLFLAAPHGPSAMYTNTTGPGAFDLAAPFIGVVGIVIGLLWMWRILRADPEPDAKNWRYRDF